MVKLGAGIKVSEVAWWEALLDVEEELAKRILIAKAQISEAKGQASGSSVKALWQRDVGSLQKRLEHLEAFSDVLADDPS